MIKIKFNSLLESNCEIIAHGCNCFCTMGRGIARQIKNQFPEAYTVDCITVKGDRSKLGTYSIANPRNSWFKIANLYTQYTWNDTSDMFYIDAFRSSLSKLLEDNPLVERIAIPAIGLGLSNAKPKEVFSTIYEVSEKYGIDIDLHIIDIDVYRDFKEWEHYYLDNW